MPDTRPDPTERLQGASVTALRLWHGFIDALGRALGNAARAGFFRRNPMIKSVRTQILDPVVSTRTDYELLKHQFEAAREFEKGTQPIHEHVSAETLERWMGNARLQWCVALAAAVFGAAAFVHGVLNAKSVGLNQMVFGLAVTLFALMQGARVARDVEILRTRQRLTVHEFFSRIETLWCPLVPGSVLWGRFFYILLPIFATFAMSVAIITSPN